MVKILVLFTGGTIGSFKVPTDKINGEQQYAIGTKTELKKKGINTDNLKQVLIEKYNKNYNQDKSVELDPYEIADVLSENMTFDKWNIITEKIRHQSFRGYDGVIITHGTDTLGYFANYLSMILNDISIPVFLVSSNYALEKQKDPNNKNSQTEEEKRANGVYNFHAACEFIKKVGLPGVYVTFRNTDKSENSTRIIYGSRVMQCNPLTNDFESITNRGNIPLATVDDNGRIDIKDDILFSILNGTNRHNTGRNSFINKFGKIKSNILMVDPLVGINYANYRLDNIDAVLHGLYHSGTACTDLDEINNIIKFYRTIKNGGKELYVGPFYGTSDNSLYCSSKDIVDAGAKFVTNTSKENAYVKLALAYAIAAAKHYSRNDIGDFVEAFMYEQVNQEFINPPIKVKKR